MVMKVFGLRFLFLVLLHFPKIQSIADVIRKRFGGEILKDIRKFERLDYQVKQCQLDIEFLYTCHKYNIIPNFLRFHVTNKTLKDSLAYSTCQQLLLSEKNRCKKRSLCQLMFEYDVIKQELQYQLSPIHFMHVSSLFLASDDKVISKNEKTYGRELQKLIPNIHKTSVIDNVSYIYNFSDCYFTDSDELLLMKGPKRIENSRFLLLFELLFRDVKYNRESSVFLASIKALLQDAAFTLARCSF